MGGGALQQPLGLGRQRCMLVLPLPLLFTYLHGFNRVFGTAPIGLIDGIAIPDVAMVCAIVVEWSKRASPAGAAQ